MGRPLLEKRGRGVTLTDTGRRLFSLSGSSRSDYWRVAWQEAEDHPLLGGGAGSYQRFWLRHRTRALVRRLITNLCLSVFAFAVAALIIRPLGLALAAWTAEKPFGLLHVVALPAAVQFGLAFLLMDLTFYYWHLANHMIPGLWRFHNVHHIDPDLDVSTALRFHVGEILLSTAFRIVQVSLIGLSPLTYMLYESVFQGSTLFHHSNVRLPLRAERLLNKVLVCRGASGS